MPRTATTRTRLGLALTATLVMPACVTRSMWRDHHDERSVAKVAPQDVRAHWSKDGKRLFVRVPADHAEFFHTDATRSRSGHWLVVTPREYGVTAFVLTTLARPTDADPKQWPTVGLERTTTWGGIQWEMRATISPIVSTDPDWILARLEGWSKPWSWPNRIPPTATFLADCDVIEVPTVASSDLDRPVTQLGLLGKIRDNEDTVFAVKALMTPVSLVLDAALVPVYIIAKLNE